MWDNQISSSESTVTVVYLEDLQYVLTENCNYLVFGKT